MDEQESNADDLIRIIVLGDNKVGKSTLIHRYLEHVLEVHEGPTLGVEYHVQTRILNKKTIRFGIWDASGAAQFLPLVERYPLDSDGALICFDITEPETFTHAMQWYDWYRQYQKNAPVILVSCKNDQDFNFFDPEFKESVETFVSNNNLNYWETSVFKNKGVKQPFLKLSEQIHFDRSLANLKQRLKLYFDCCSTNSSHFEHYFFSSRNSDNVLEKHFATLNQAVLCCNNLNSLQLIQGAYIQLLANVTWVFKKENPFKSIYKNNDLENQLKIIIHALSDFIKMDSISNEQSSFCETSRML